MPFHLRSSLQPAHDWLWKLKDGILNLIFLFVTVKIIPKSYYNPYERPPDEQVYATTTTTTTDTAVTKEFHPLDFLATNQSKFKIFKQFLIDSISKRTNEQNYPSFDLLAGLYLHFHLRTR